MHELPIMREVLKSVRRNAQLDDTVKLLSVTLRVGRSRDLIEDLVQKYWDYITRGTAEEGSVIKIHIIPNTCRCNDCGNVFDVDFMVLDNVHCNDCGSEKSQLLTGLELEIEEVAVTTAISE